jgi:hypothetical protein
MTTKQNPALPEIGGYGKTSAPPTGITSTKSGLPPPQSMAPTPDGMPAIGGYGAPPPPPQTVAAAPPPTPPDPIAGMPRLPSPFDIPVVADLAEGFFGRSPLGAIRNFVAEQIGGGKIPTQQEKTAAAEQRSPVATGAGRVLSDVTTGNALLGKLGLFGAGAAPEIIDSVVNKKVLNTDEKPLDWGKIAQTGMNATAQGLGAKFLGDTGNLARTAMKYSPTGFLAGLHPVTKGIRDAAMKVIPNSILPSPAAMGLPAGLLEVPASFSTERETAALRESRKRSEEAKKAKR